MHASAAGYVLTYVTPPKLLLVSRTAVGLTAAKFKPLVHPMQGFFLSSTTHFGILWCRITSARVLHNLVM
jgi:hypothetical protein